MYEKTNWIDKETPVSATNMNKMEEGIFDAHASAMRLNDFDNFVLYGPDAPTKIYPTDASHIILTGPPANYTLEVQNAPNNSAKKYIIRNNLTQAAAKLTIAFADGGTSYTLRKGDTLYAITKTIAGVSSHSGFVVNGFHSSSYLPTLRFGGSGTGITYAERTGYYTRVGNLVTFHAYIKLSSKGFATGTAELSLPVTPGRSFQNISVYCEKTVGLHHPPILTTIEGSSMGELRTIPSTDPLIPYQVVTQANCYDDTVLSVTGSYYCI